MDGFQVTLWVAFCPTAVRAAAIGLTDRLLFRSSSSTIVGWSTVVTGEMLSMMVLPPLLIRLNFSMISSF